MDLWPTICCISSKVFVWEYNMVKYQHTICNKLSFYLRRHGSMQSSHHDHFQLNNTVAKCITLNDAIILWLRKCIKMCNTLQFLHLFGISRSKFQHRYSIMRKTFPFYMYNRFANSSLQRIFFPFVYVQLSLCHLMMLLISS